MNYKNFSIAKKIIIGFILISIISGIVGIVGIINLRTSKNAYKILYEKMTEPIQDMSSISTAFQRTRIHIRDLVAAENDEAINKEIANIALRDQEIKKAETEFKLNIISDSMRDMFNQYEKLDKLYDGYRNEILEFVKAKKVDDATKVLKGEGLKAALELQDIINKIQQQKIEDAKSNVDSNTKAANTTEMTMIAIVILGFLSSVAYGVFISKSISKPLNKAVKSLNEAAQQVTAASEQLAASSEQLAEANGEQASSIEEVSATLEESSTVIQESAAKTIHVADIVSKTRVSADRGNTEMNEMISAMSDINKSSSQISKIIKVIDEIAFQTNILALNAAVEAARAGEAGLGFAVVAEEVRNLAHRSAQAAKDTADIIESNIQLSETGLVVTHKVGESLLEITKQSQTANNLMDEISIASQEQAQGIVQINKAILQMEKVTQISAANSEETAASAEELNSQAMTMSEILGQLVEVVNGKTANVYPTAYESRKTANVYPTPHESRKKTINGENSALNKTHSKSSTFGKMKSSENRSAANSHQVIRLEDNSEF